MLSDRLEHQVGEMLRLEAWIASSMDQLEIPEEDAVGRLVSRVTDLARVHIEGLRRRQNQMGWAAPPSEQADPQGVGSEYPMSATLVKMSGALNEAVSGYSVLRSVALRFRDSPLAGDENTADLAVAHAKDYVEALVAVNRLLNDVVLAELDADGASCSCTCSCCGLGLCLCAQATRRLLSDLWIDAGPISVDEGVFIHSPRPGSPAALAGLGLGDTLVTADGHHLDSHFTLQKVVQSHGEGEDILFEVRRTAGDTETVTIARS